MTAVVAKALPAPPNSPERLRLFFALWPGQALREQLVRHQALWPWAEGARPTPAPKLHLTLLFMEGVPAERVGELLELGAALAPQWRDFALTLDRAACWPRGGIAHLAPSNPPDALLDWRQHLVDRVAALDLPLDDRPFAPHVTLARRAQTTRPPTDFEPLCWPVTRFALVRSVLGTGRYEVLGRWP